MTLLLDVGNTRLKWALSDGVQIAGGGAIVHQGKPAGALSSLMLESPDAVWIASVAGPVHERALADVCVARWSCTPLFAITEAARDGLVNGYAEPLRLGVDRWLAMLAAWTETRGACVVADAGTALTVDVIDTRGRHLGGIIAAGLQTSESAVLGATRFPTRDTPLAAHAGLGLDTEACVRQGAMLSVLGAIDRAAAAVPTARRLVAGGDAQTLLPFLGAGWEHRPELVFEGLLAVARSA
ncbi:MAG: type III pantothenate kinase [Panacagrimonas sp.]